MFQAKAWASLPVAWPGTEAWGLPSEKLPFEAWQDLPATEKEDKHSSERNVEVRRVQLLAEEKAGSLHSSTETHCLSK